jgi:hypothetical protein
MLWSYYSRWKNICLQKDEQERKIPAALPQRMENREKKRKMDIKN